MTLTDDHYTLFGVSATYTPAGGSGSAVTILFRDQPDLDEAANEPGARVHRAEICVRQSEVDSRPGYLDTFAITDGVDDSQTWTVVPDGVRERRPAMDFAGEWVCVCERETRPVL